LRSYSAVTYFLFNDAAPTETYTLSLHDALPISVSMRRRSRSRDKAIAEIGNPRSRIRSRIALARYFTFASAMSCGDVLGRRTLIDRKSTRLNSSHRTISYAVFCLKKKRTHTPYS